ncbi:unnamed protein product [Symbiodinium sp. CCMP2592]|nr:unnamed protein product [Symbiodinium sp. CCMP2592]
MAGLMDREMVRSRSRDKKGAVGGMRGWSDSDSDDGKYQLKAPTKLAPVSGWKQAENKKPAGSQDIFLRSTPVISGIRLLPAPGLDDDEEEGSDGEKIRKPVASRGKPLKAASADDLAHVRGPRKETSERKADQEDAPKPPRKSKEDKAPKADGDRESKETKKRREEDQGESRSKKEKDRNGTDRGRGDDGRARRGDEDRDRERKEDRKEDRDRREKPRDDRRDRRDDHKDDRHERRDEDRRDRREEHDRHDRREGRDRDRGRTDRRDRDRDRDRSRDRR